MRWVIDTSVALKWYVPEPGSEMASGLLERALNENIALVAPDLILPEIGNALWKKHRRGELLMREIDLILDTVAGSFPVRILSSGRLLPAAVEIAVTYGQTVYDSLYVALAVMNRAAYITADRKLVAELGQTPLASTVLWLDDEASQG